MMSPAGISAMVDLSIQALHRRHLKAKWLDEQTVRRVCAEIVMDLERRRGKPPVIDPE